MCKSHTRHPPMAATPDRIPWVEKYDPPPSHFRRIHVAFAGTVRTASRTSWATTRAWRDCASSRRTVRMRLLLLLLRAGGGGRSIRLATHSPIATIFIEFTLISSNICHLFHLHLHHHPTSCRQHAAPHPHRTARHRQDFQHQRARGGGDALALYICFNTRWVNCFAAVGRDEQRSSAHAFLELLSRFRTL